MSSEPSAEYLGAMRANLERDCTVRHHQGSCFELAQFDQTVDKTHDRAIPLLESLCQSNHAKACFALGMAHLGAQGSWPYTQACLPV